MWARQDLLAELKGLGLLRGRELERSFLRVRQESFLPELFGPLAYADMPLPLHAGPNPSTMPSARCLIAALDLLEPRNDVRILVAGCRGGYPGALLAEVVGPERVVVVETDPERRARTVERMQAAGFEGVQVLRSVPNVAFDPVADPCQEAARRAFQAAYILQSAGELERAADAYERSLKLAPSGEAHTFHGWTFSFLGRYDDAIEECKRAIAVDPSFGNPYNDIGAYLIEVDRLDEAIPWLEKAIAAP